MAVDDSRTFRPRCSASCGALTYETASSAVPAIEAVGYEEFCAGLTELFDPLYVDGLGVRISSEFGWVTARSG